MSSTTRVIAVNSLVFWTVFGLGAFHFAAHVVDRHLGGSVWDTAGLAVLAAPFVAGAFAQQRRVAA